MWVEELHNKFGYLESLLMFYAYTHTSFNSIASRFGLNFVGAHLNFLHQFANAHIEHLIVRTGRVTFSHDLTHFYTNSSHYQSYSSHPSTRVALTHPLKYSLDITFHGPHI